VCLIDAIMEQLLADVLKSVTVKDVANLLNVAVGTVERWLLNKSVPADYRFDLLKMLGREISYESFSSAEKAQFFTSSAMVSHCWSVFCQKVHVSLSQYLFIEPSAGDGSFLCVLPPHRLAFDIEPRHPEVVKQDYLLWRATPSCKYIVFGNPPFGLRGHLALKFLNHSATFADYVCFILPQLFESDGKGSPRKRVIGLSLIHSEKLSGMFRTPEGSEVLIHCVFQIWSKHTKNETYLIETPPVDRLKIYSLSDGGTQATTRNKSMLSSCHIYLPSTCFGKEAMRVYDSFESLPNRKGYGLVFLVDRVTQEARARSIDWGSVSFLSTNSAYNLRTSLIYKKISESA